MNYKSFYMKPGYSLTYKRIYHGCSDGTRTVDYKKYAGTWNNYEEDWRMLAPCIFGEW